MSLTWLGLILSGLGLFFSSWIVVPAPTFSLLPLAVGAPEISPLLLLGNGVMLAIALLQRQGKRLRRVAIGCSAIGLVLSSLPLLQLPATINQANTQMQAVLGSDDLMQISANQMAQWRPHPFALRDLVTGISVPAVSPDRQEVSTLDGDRLQLEIYQPTAAGLHPAIVTIYGGAWQRGEPSDNQQFAWYMVAQGYTVVAIDYRHVPQFRFPTQLHDVQAALQWVASYATTYKIDLTRIALMGWSSGAHLALLAAYQNSAIPVRAVIDYYGPTDLTAGYHDPPFPDPINTKAVLEAFLGGTPTQLPQPYRLASPVHVVKPGLPPTLLIYGKRDHLVKPVFGQQLADRLRSTDNAAVLILLPWAEHSFNSVFSGLGNQLALYYTERFVAWALR